MKDISSSESCATHNWAQNGWQPKTEQIPNSGTDARPARAPSVFVPVDFSPASMEAARVGLRIAGSISGQLVLCHALTLNLTPYGPANLPAIKAGLYKEASQRAEPIMIAAQQAGVPAICLIEEGKPAEVITRMARRWNADLIVLTTRLRGGLMRFLRRRTAEQIMRKAPCPVVALQAG